MLEKKIDLASEVDHFLEVARFNEELGRAKAERHLLVCRPVGAGQNQNRHPEVGARAQAHEDIKCAGFGHGNIKNYQLGKRIQITVIERRLPGQISQRQLAVRNPMKFVRQTRSNESFLQERESRIGVFGDKDVSWTRHF